MSDLHDIAPLQFNWTAADALVAELRSTANELDTQIGARKQIGAGARKQWEGSYAHQFDERMSTCTSDAQRFITSMRQAANDLEELARLAHQEQHRREQARKWIAQQQDKGLVEEFCDGVKSFFGGGDDVPPPSPPVDPPKIAIYDVRSTSRGSATPTPVGRR
jgi:uncharacterized protein YukE